MPQSQPLHRIVANQVTGAYLPVIEELYQRLEQVGSEKADILERFSEYVRTGGDRDGFKIQITPDGYKDVPAPPSQNGAKDTKPSAVKDAVKEGVHGT